MPLSSTINSEKEIKSFPEIHLIDIISFLRKYFILFILSGAIFGFIGILVSYTIPKSYIARTILLPEYSTGKTSFFSMAMGGNSGDGIGNLTPDLYPNILESSAFGEFLLKEPVTSADGVQFDSLKKYLQRETTKSFISKILSIFSFGKPKSNQKSGTAVKINNKQVLNYSGSEIALINAAKGMVTASIEQKNGLISIESELQDPVVAAMLVEVTKQYLVDYVEDFRTGKLKMQLDFLSSQVNQARKRQQNAEYALQSYRDHNRNPFLNTARIEEQRLQSDYTLAQSIYSDMIIKLEQIKIRVKEERPVFKVLEATKVPLDSSKPRRLIMAILYASFGAFACLLYVLFMREKVYTYFIK